ncbi:MAG: flagellar export chaperone FlgN [Rhodocyclaceae bacterium]|nr:flagellar export chaperone FlgN [Rhodocyclaceae bacterium]
MSAAEALRAFIDVLRREQALLTEGSIDSLAPLIAEKTALADRLNQMPASEAAALRELAAEARALNEINGKLIALRLQHNQQALNILLAAADSATTYGPDGQQQTGLGSRILGKA